ncbi:IS4 family transposase [Hypericibacter sp.]|uniref:IS4 family transposase n=1 Tax=Hypericibacter sp. TaxID=2705401 RepID=UPI003D6D1FDD
MQYMDSIFVSLLKPIDRRHFRSLIARHDGDAYDKSFKSWDHLVALTYTQFSQATSLRGVVAGFNANPNCHYHLGVRKISRSTLSDANARRPVGVFSALFETLSQAVDRQVRQEGAEMLRLIDASPIPLGKVCGWAGWNGRIRGLKMHVVYDPKNDRPCSVEVTPATINDIEAGRRVALEAGATYVFDKGYCHYGWWRQIDAADAVFVTRAKSNMRLRATRRRKPRKVVGDGFRVIDDAEVRLVSKGDSKLAIALRRIRVRREKGGLITLITNDMTRSAVEIAALYKIRWQIELLFRWIKQHLVIRKFLGNNENAIHLQILGAMIAYLLLRIAARLHRVKIPLLRLAELVGQSLFTRRTIHRIDRPPPVNPSKPKPKTPANQLAFCYA